MMSTENPKNKKKTNDITASSENEGQKKINEVELYEEALQILEANVDRLDLYQKARGYLEQIPHYKDASKLIDRCSEKIIVLTLRADEKKKKRKRIITVTALIFVALVIVFLVMSRLQTADSEKMTKYEQAVKYLDQAENLTGNSQANRYNNAYTILAELGDFNNAAALIVDNKIKRIETMTDNSDYDGAMRLYLTLSADPALTDNEKVIAAGNYITETIHTRAMDAYNKEEYYAALELFRRLDQEDAEIITYIDNCQLNAIKAADIGGVVKFGTYQQSATSGDFDFSEDVDWIVVAKEGNKYLLVSNSVLDTVQFNKEYVEITWKDSYIRSYLNAEFYSEMFSESESSHVLESDITTDGTQTKDRIFLLSKEEAAEYMSSSLKADVSEYAVRRLSKYYQDYKSISWWLRDTVDDTALAVTHEGKLTDTGYHVSADFVGIRPAVWITID